MTRMTPGFARSSADDVPVLANVPITITPIVTTTRVTLESWIFGGL